jgi:hypothetical protein
MSEPSVIGSICFEVYNKNQEEPVMTAQLHIASEGISGLESQHPYKTHDCDRMGSYI